MLLVASVVSALSLPATSAIAAELTPAEAELSGKIDALWVLLAGGLVFFMQAGFLCFEVGSVRRKNMELTAMKNIVDWVVVSLLFFLVGFGLMFGPSSHGIIGVGGFLDTALDDPKGLPLGWIFFLFQLAFAGTSATIVSGAMAERTTFRSYLVFSAFMGAVIYPVFGHWVWGNAYYADNKPWLASLGYVDFAGSSVVHMVGGAASLVGVKILGPRLGRFSSAGRVNTLAPGNLAWSALGTLILWFGWWGFNGGSTLAFNKSVGPIIFNTNIAACAGGIVAFLHAVLLQKSSGVQEKFLGGILGALVAITANCHIVSPLSALAIGAIAGVLHNLSYEFTLRVLKLDDVVGAAPVHFFCGAWGIVAVAIFGRATELTNGRLAQLGIQVLGVVVCTVWTVVLSAAAWSLLKVTMGIRVSPMKELRGLEVSEASAAVDASAAK